MESSGTVERALDVLFHLHALGEPSGVSDIGRAVALPKSTVHRLLSALWARGVVERDARGRYHTGMALVALGVGVLQREPVVHAARPALEEQARASGETFFLVAARAGHPSVLDKVEGTGFLRASPRVGDTVPVHATAVGKVFLAFQPSAVEPVAVTGAALEAFTPATLTDRASLAGELARVRAQGYAESRDEWIDGLSAIAAPVRLRGQVVGVIAVAAPTPRVVQLSHGALAERALAAAARTEARLQGVSR
jgi:DNA-binding IclR family transcriptional regulator